jgi:hypothetical protein
MIIITLKRASFSISGIATAHETIFILKFIRAPRKDVIESY